MQKPKFKVLTIDGGGIRGVIPACLLAYIEAQTDKPISKSFDLIAATSTGGFLATVLTKPNPLKAEKLVNLYEQRGAEIFPHPGWRKIRMAIEEKYDHEPLEGILKEYLGDATLVDCLKPLLVTAYDIEMRKPFFFKTLDGQQDCSRNYRLRDVARATSAVPAYFEPMLLAGQGTAPPRPLIDGGVVANHPGMCAYVEALKMGKSPGEIFMVSLGCGSVTRPIPYEQAKNWGLAQWMVPLIHILLDGPNDAVDHQLSQVLGNRYYRLTTDLVYALDDLDVATKGNIDNLKREAFRILDNETVAIKEIIEILS